MKLCIWSITTLRRGHQLEYSILDVQVEKKAAPKAAVAAKAGKRKGPLPLWLAELLVIFGLGGILYAVIRWWASQRICNLHSWFMCQFAQALAVPWSANSESYG